MVWRWPPNNTEKIEHNMKALLELDVDENLKEAMEEWLEFKGRQ